MNRYDAIACLLLAIAPLVPRQAQAQRFPERWSGPREPAREQAPRTERSLDRAVEQLRGETRGRVLSADTEFVEGREVHVIRILTKDGRVRRLRIDAESGQRIRRR